MVLLLVFTALVDFHVGQLIYTTKKTVHKKMLLAASLIANFGMLAFFKYTNFLIESLNTAFTYFQSDILLSTFNIILPIGISFYTFQTMSYTIDIYRGEFKPINSLLTFMLFVSYFPHMVAGPIIRAKFFLPQLKHRISLLPENFKKGITLIGWGLVKKMVFADNIAPFVNAFFSNPNAYEGSIPVMLAALAFGVQIYCDFSGYSDIAIGLARVMGLTILPNFDKPYFSTNFSMFWRRWHMSLSAWLKDYVYVPLGGNRKGALFTHINLMITMLLGGLWHGASWNFLIWGFYQGTLLCSHKVWTTLGFSSVLEKLGEAKRYIALIVTQYFVFLGWLIFRTSDGQALFHLIVRYLSFDLTLLSMSKLLQSHYIPLLFLAAFIFLHTFSFFNKDILDRIYRCDLFTWGFYLLMVIISLLFLGAASSGTFIYFQF
jgi:alginate O-acetyltransferase complex protein AlgI